VTLVTKLLLNPMLYDLKTLVLSALLLVYRLDDNEVPLVECEFIDEQYR
jgi:hypothetical protein